MEFKVNTYGTPQMIGKKLVKTGRKIDSMNMVMEEIFVDMLWGNWKNIDSAGHRGGGSYAQLTPFTLKKKGSAEILFTEGARRGYTKIGGDALVNSVTQPDAEFQIKRISNAEVALGTRRPHARVHQYGHRGKPNVPARPFLAMIPSDVDRWKGWIAAHLLEAMKSDV